MKKYQLTIAKLLLLFVLWLGVCIQKTFAQQDSILVFVPDQTYYSEYSVLTAALTNMGYVLDIRSANSPAVTPYLIPANATVQGAANSMPGSNYAAFTALFQSVTGQLWDASLNTVPDSIPHRGSIFTVMPADMSRYQAFIILGGIGATFYELDNDYVAHAGLSGNNVEIIAHHLNRLGLAALNQDKIVGGTCHGSSVPVYWQLDCGALNCARILDGQNAAGFAADPTNTQAKYSLVNVNYVQSARIMVSSTTLQFASARSGTPGTVITSAYWYPQDMVAYADTLRNRLNPSPTPPDSVPPVVTTPEDSILIFVADDTYYTEYATLTEALTKLGYFLDIRSATANPVTAYTIPAGSTVQNAANSLGGSNYNSFLQQFQKVTGQPWNEAINSVPPPIAHQGNILDITPAQINQYKAFIVLGGIGATYYERDGDYAPHAGLLGNQVGTVAEHLNVLGLAAMNQNKIVGGVCHGSSVPVYWRLDCGAANSLTCPSILEGQNAAGFLGDPINTQAKYNLVNVNYVQNLIVGVSQTTPQFSAAQGGLRGKVLTLSSWYPQHVLRYAETLHRLLTSTPENTHDTVNVVLLHGGALNPGNCGPGNLENDIPCNHPHTPADYTHVEALLQANSANDNFAFQVTSVNLGIPGTLPFDPNNEQQVLDYLVANAEVVVMYKHWVNYLPVATQNAIVRFVEEHGRGLFMNHHALYNHHHNGQNKAPLVTLAGAQASSFGFGLFMANQTLYNVTPHFINTYGLDMSGVATTPNQWLSNTGAANALAMVERASTFTVNDEVYSNMTFESVNFGDAPNSVLPILGTNALSGDNALTTGFVRRVSVTDSIVGKVAYIQIGELPQNYDLASSPTAQMFRNAIYWVSVGESTSTSLATFASARVSNFARRTSFTTKLFPNPTTKTLTLTSDSKIRKVEIYDLLGKLRKVQTLPMAKQTVAISVGDLPPGIYWMTLHGTKGFTHSIKFIKK